MLATFLAFIPFALVVLFALYATREDDLTFKMLVPITTGAIIFFLFWDWVMGWTLFGALIFSAVGDFFLSNQKKNTTFMYYGLGAYAMTNILYGMSWISIFGFNSIALLISVIVFTGVVVAFKMLKSTLETWFLAVLFIYAMTMAFSVGQAFHPQIVFPLIANLSIAVSDTIIGLNLFVLPRGNLRSRLDGWILPTYFLAHILFFAQFVLLI